MTSQSLDETVAKDQATDADGIARFEVAPGEYFVDAQVCCIGPGFIEYHEPVQVVARQTAQVQLLACLKCL